MYTRTDLSLAPADVEHNPDSSFQPGRLHQDRCDIERTAGGVRRVMTTTETFGETFSQHAKASPNGDGPSEPPDIAIARRLIRLGVPIFVAERAADFPHGGTGDTGYYLPSGWQETRPDESVLDTYRDGDALCAVMGHVYDVLDTDPRNGGDDSFNELCDALAGDTPLSYGSVTTPSGGWHDWIATLGIGKHTDFWKSAGWNGLDLQGGRPDGSSVGSVFIPPTERRSKVDGEVYAYQWDDPPEKPEPGDESGGALSRLIVDSAGSGRTAGSKKKGAAQDGTGKMLTQRELRDYIKHGIPEDEPQDETLARCVWAWRVRSARKEWAYQRWLTIVSKTTLTDPAWPFTRDDFDRHWKGADEKRSAQEAAEREARRHDDDHDLSDANAHAAPKYPVDKLIGPLADLVASSALPAPLVAGAGLAALAGVCPAAQLWVYTDLVPPIVWIADIAPSGGGKSPAITRAFQQSREQDSVLYAAYSQQLDAWKATPSGQRGPKPADRTHLIEDMTIEKLARQLKESPHRIAVHDELASGIKNIGQYKRQNGDRDRYLGLWTGGPWRYSRVGGDVDILVEHPVLTIVGGLQIARLDVLGGDEDGFRPRWLPHLSDADDIPWVASRTATEWDAAIKALYKVIGQRRDWELCGRGKPTEAQLLWQEAGARWKAEARTEPKNMVRVALTKADQQAARVALVIAESMDPGAGGKIPADAMACAIAIIDYVMDVWRSLDDPDVLAYSRKDEAIHKTVLAWAARAKANGGKVSTRELQRGRVGGVRDRDKFNDVLDAYENYYPGCVTTEKHPGGGRAITWVHAPETAS